MAIHYNLGNFRPELKYQVNRFNQYSIILLLHFQIRLSNPIHFTHLQVDHKNSPYFPHLQCNHNQHLTMLVKLVLKLME